MQSADDDCGVRSGRRKLATAPLSSPSLRQCRRKASQAVRGGRREGGDEYRYLSGSLSHCIRPHFFAPPENRQLHHVPITTAPCLSLFLLFKLISLTEQAGQHSQSFHLFFFMWTLPSRSPAAADGEGKGRNSLLSNLRYLPSLSHQVLGKSFAFLLLFLGFVGGAATANDAISGSEGEKEGKAGGGGGKDRGLRSTHTLTDVGRREILGVP